MNNLILFINSFLSYLVTYAVFIVCAVGCALLGIALRKHQNKKEEAANEDAVS